MVFRLLILGVGEGLRNLQFIIVPGIVIGVIGGILLFFAAYNYYPQKNVNINLNGKCYEFLDEAYKKYQDLVSNRERELLKLQIDSLDGSNTFVPIIFSGSSNDVEHIIDKFDINVTEKQTLGDQNTKVDKIIVRGVVSNVILEQLLDNISENITDASMNLMPKFGILPNSAISASESAKISDNIDQFMISGLKQIIVEKNGVKDAECRSTIVYND
ncbi:MAG TPA: hypothetical protein VJL78_08345 [Candidatus Nitrosocosmicus sp.]|nr:hypothetical protein [Candidatus Nitrosocosmicus sp.]